MEKNRIQLWEVVAETLSAIALVVYIGLQIYYGFLYYGGLRGISYEIVYVPLLYVGMLVLQRYPEFLNGMRSEPLAGQVRYLAVCMVRTCKLILMIGILIPAVADIWGMYLNAAFSLLLMVGLLVVIVYYMYRIYQYNKSQNNE